MTRPAQSQIESYEDDSPKQWNLSGIASFVLKKNGLFVTACLALIVFQTMERRERDTQVIGILTTNAKILSDLNASVTSNDARDQKSMEEMKPCVTRIESDLRDIKNELNQLKK